MVYPQPRVKRMIPTIPEAHETKKRPEGRNGDGSIASRVLGQRLFSAPFPSKLSAVLGLLSFLETLGENKGGPQLAGGIQPSPIRQNGTV